MYLGAGGSCGLLNVKLTPSRCKDNNPLVYVALARLGPLIQLTRGVFAECRCLIGFLLMLCNCLNVANSSK